MTELREKLNNIVEEKQSKITPDNIKAGVKVFDVDGEFTSDATATAGDIAKDKTAYVNGEKITGTLEMSDNNAMLDEEGLTVFTVKTALKEVKDLDMSGITSMANAFNGCTKLQKIKLYNTNKVKKFLGTFSDCSALIEAPEMNTSIATNMESMFRNCSSLEYVPLYDTSKVKTMLQIFNGCSSLKEAPLFDTTNVTDMSSMFLECSSIESIPQYNTSKVTTVLQMFHSCSKLKDVPFLDWSSVTETGNAFVNCFNLSDESLNNILLMCSNVALSRAQYQTLKYCGLTSAQATRCKKLTNYQAFLDAGWQTGF